MTTIAWRDVLDLLACPSADHAPLTIAEADGTTELVCTVCATRYPVRGDIPVLLVDDATPGPNGIGVPADLPESVDSPRVAEDS